MKDNLFTSILGQVRATDSACAAINILNYCTARSIMLAAERVKCPVILQPSVGTVRRYRVADMFYMLDGIRKVSPYPIAIHLDHCTDESLAFACVDAGWDSVMVDYSAKPLDENISLTKRAVEYAHARGVSVEGEVGVIGGVEDDISADVSVLANFEDTIRFFSETGCDAVAPAVGTAHGEYKAKPNLNFSIVRELSDAGVPVVIHGGTGLTAEDFRRFIENGAVKINISTVLKRVYISAIKKNIQFEVKNIVEFDKDVECAIGAEIEKYLRLFAGEEVQL